MTCPRDCLACRVEAVLGSGEMTPSRAHLYFSGAAIPLARRVHELEAEVAALRLGTPISVEAWKRAKKI